MDPVVLTVIATGIALFAANWRVQAGWFATVDKRFEAAEKQSRERFEAVDRQFVAAESRNRERFEAIDRQLEAMERRDRERFEAADRRWTERFDAAEKRNEAAHAAIWRSASMVSADTCGFVIVITPVLARPVGGLVHNPLLTDRSVTRYSLRRMRPPW